MVAAYTIGDALKRVSLGYFQKNNTGNILNSITTGLNTLENMGIRMIDNFVGGYLNFLFIFLCLLLFSPVTALIALAGATGSFLFLLRASGCSARNAPVAAKAGKNLSAAVLKYARGLPNVKSFGQGGAAQQSMKEAAQKSRDIALTIEYSFLPQTAGIFWYRKLHRSYWRNCLCIMSGREYGTVGHADVRILLFRNLWFAGACQ